jgi:hypothetical protein
MPQLSTVEAPTSDAGALRFRQINNDNQWLISDEPARTVDDGVTQQERHRWTTTTA